ncbi:MAG: glycosyltransferase family 39 protein [Candidatus Protistobacter heckmanni]|nr:glycosyltransferase family 39 protein [Candidatus Protistobacter heckmanni]
MASNPLPAPLPSLPSRRTLILLAVLLALVWFGCLEYRHLIRTDEGRYAEIAREMFASGDWVTIRYNDYKYFEKPPLQAWATALAYELFDVGAWQARLWTALTGFLTVLAAGFAGAALFGRAAGLLAAVMLAGAPMWSGASHFNTLDMGVSATMCWALFALLLAQRPGITAAAQRNWMWACWAAMALAMLSKGLIGIVLPGLVLAVYTVLARDWALWKRLHIVSGLAIFLVIAAPWFVLIAQRNPEFLQFFFIHEHFQRFTTNVHARQGPIYYFVPLLLVGFLPWLAQLVPAACRACREWLGKDAQAGAPGEPRPGVWANGLRPRLMLALWAGLIFAFFSVSHSKLSGYIVPIFPALALLAGDALAAGLPRWWPRQLLALGLISAAGLACTPLVAGLAKRPFEAPEYAAYAVWVGAALAVMLMGCILAWRLYRRGASPGGDGGTASVLAVSGAMFLTLMIAGNGHETLGRSLSGADLAAKVRPLLQPGDPFYAVRGLDHTMPFYLGTTMMMVQSSDELAFGAAQEPQKFSPDVEDFAKRWAGHTRAFAMMSPDTYEDLRQRGVPMREVARDERRVIVTKP